MARLWEKWLIDNKPNYKKIWALLGALFDIGLLALIILTMFWHSCEICYSSNSINGVTKSCESVTKLYENGTSSFQKDYPMLNIPNTNRLP